MEIAFPSLTLGRRKEENRQEKTTGKKIREKGKAGKISEDAGEETLTGNVSRNVGLTKPGLAAIGT